MKSGRRACELRLMSTSLTVLVVAGALALLLILSALRIVREYQRVVVCRLGRLRGARGPGLVLIIPLIERTRWVNLQVDTADIPPQDLITKDNVTIRVEAAVFYRVVDPVKAVVAIRDYKHGVMRIAQTTLQATLGQHELDDLLANQAAINELLKQIIDASTEPWGVNVVKVETKDVDLPDTMKRAMARQAEAERERRAKVIAAEGDYQAAERLSQAAGVIAREPGTLTLRTLQTLAEVATEHNSTLVLPIPIDVLEAVRHHAEATTPTNGQQPWRARLRPLRLSGTT
jgi:regulator of protease activity HflC (stomatin/prohibitin superfamily)